MSISKYIVSTGLVLVSATIFCATASQAHDPHRYSDNALNYDYNTGQYYAYEDPARYGVRPTRRDELAGNSHGHHYNLYSGQDGSYTTNRYGYSGDYSERRCGCSRGYGTSIHAQRHNNRDAVVDERLQDYDLRRY